MKFSALSFALWLGATVCFEGSEPSPSTARFNVAVHIRGPGGTPIGRVKVFAVRELAQGIFAQAESDKQGNARLSSVPAGAKLLVLHRDYLPAELDAVAGSELAVRLLSGRKSRVEPRLPAGADSARHIEARMLRTSWLGRYDTEALPVLTEFQGSIDLPTEEGYAIDVGGPGFERRRVLGPGPHSPILRSGTSLRGRIELEEGVAKGPILVHIAPLRAHPSEPLDPLTRRVGFVLTDGSFRIDELPSGERLGILVEPVAGAPVWRSLDRLDSRPVNVRIARGGTVRGKVACEDAIPEGLRVKARLQPDKSGFDFALWRSVRVEEDGRFAIPGLSAGSLWVDYAAQNRRQGTARLNVPSDKYEHDLGVLCPGKPANLRGTVRSSDGKPIEEAVASYGTGRTKTDPKGNFSLSASEPSEEHLRIEKKGYLPWARWVRLGDAVPGFAVTLLKGARVLGTAVNRDTREPIHGAEVELYLANRPGGAKRADPSSNKSGRFESPSLEPGSYSLILSAPGFQSRKIPVDDLSEGEIRNLGPVPLVKGLEVRGRILSPDGTPVKEGDVALRASSLPGYLRGTRGLDTFSSHIDAQGRFRLGGLKDGEYRLRVGAKGFADLTQELSLVEDLDLGDLIVKEGCQLRGVVKDSAGNPVSGLTIEARAGDTRNIAEQRTVSTDENGDFAIENLNSGLHALVVRSGRRKIKESQAVLEGEPCEKDVDIRVGGTTLEGLAVRRGVALGDRPLTLRPLMAGAPQVASTSVYLRSVAPDGDETIEEVIGRGSETRFFRTDESGFYSVSWLEPGQWESALQDGARVLTCRVNVPDASLVREDLDFTGRSVDGVVVRAGPKEPLAAVQVRLLPPDSDTPVDIAETDSLGRFGFIDVTMPIARLSATKPGFESRIVSIDLSGPSAISQTQIELRATRQRVSGVVYTADGTAAAGAQILWMLDVVGAPRGGTETADSEGRFIISDLEPGMLKALSFLPGFGAQPGYITLQSSDEEKTLDLRLSAASSIRILLPVEELGGTLRLFAGPADFTQLLWRAGIVPNAQAAGVWVWPGLGPGHYRLTGPNGSRDFELGAGEQREVDLRRN